MKGHRRTANAKAVRFDRARARWTMELPRRSFPPPSELASVRFRRIAPVLVPTESGTLARVTTCISLVHRSGPDWFSQLGEARTVRTAESQGAMRCEVSPAPPELAPAYGRGPGPATRRRLRAPPW